MNHNQVIANRLVALAAGLLDGSVQLITANTHVEEHMVKHFPLGKPVEMRRVGPATHKIDIEYIERSNRG